jgi:hypothetical protein
MSFVPGCHLVNLDGDAAVPSGNDDVCVIKSAHITGGRGTQESRAGGTTIFWHFEILHFEERFEPVLSPNVRPCSSKVCRNLEA